MQTFDLSAGDVRALNGRLHGLPPDTNERAWRVVNPRGAHAVAVGLTLIYGVLHIINFAHGSLLMLAMYAVFFLWKLSGVDPYVALPLVTAGAFVVGFVLYRVLIGRFSHGKDENILLITLGVSVVADNAALLFFGGDSETIDVPYAGKIIEVGAAFLPLPKVVSCAAAIVICGAARSARTTLMAVPESSPSFMR